MNVRIIYVAMHHHQYNFPRSKFFHHGQISPVGNVVELFQRLPYSQDNVASKRYNHDLSLSLSLSCRPMKIKSDSWKSIGNPIQLYTRISNTSSLYLVSYYLSNMYVFLDGLK